MNFLVSFSLVEVFVLIALLIIVAGFLVSALSKGGNKAARITMQRLVKAQCVDKNSGEIDVSITEIDQSILDVLTQGFTLNNFKAKLVWRKVGKKCVYKVKVIYESEGEKRFERESEEEIEIPNCPA